MSKETKLSRETTEVMQVDLGKSTIKIGFATVINNSVDNDTRTRILKEKPLKDTFTGALNDLKKQSQDFVDGLIRFFISAQCIHFICGVKYVTAQY